MKLADKQFDYELTYFPNAYRRDDEGYGIRPVLLNSFTLDTNCLIAIDESRPEAQAIRALANAHRDGRAKVALVAISASERQRDGKMLDNFDLFKERVSALDLSHLELLLPMCYWDVMFWDACLMVEPGMVELESKIQSILFPTVPSSWADYCKTYALDPNDNLIGRKWKNAKCDVQAFWCHAFHKRSIFVTTDGNFHAATKKPKLIALAPGRVDYPNTAAALL